jgi:flagellar basal body-associated protein FliL
MESVSFKRVAGWIIAAAGTLVLVLLLVLGAMALFRGFGRSQARADAKNSVAISQIEIRNQAQRVLIAKQKADIRLQDAIGVREAQDEIAKTLTPLYVQFEMVDALKQIATSGSNNSVVYIPAGANGIPLVSNVAQGQVGPPDKSGG